MKNLRRTQKRNRGLCSVNVNIVRTEKHNTSESYRIYTCTCELVSKKKSIPMSKLLDTILSKMLVHGYHETESLCAHCGIVNKTKVSYSEFSLNKHERREIRKNHKIVLEIEV